MGEGCYPRPFFLRSVSPPSRASLCAFDLEAQREAVEFPEPFHLRPGLVELEVGGKRPAFVPFRAQFYNATIQSGVERPHLRTETVEVGELNGAAGLAQIDLYLTARHTPIPRSFPETGHLRLLGHSAAMSCERKQRAHHQHQNTSFIHRINPIRSSECKRRTVVETPRMRYSARLHHSSRRPY